MYCQLVSVGADAVLHILKFLIMFVMYKLGLELCQAQVWLGVEV